MKQTKLKKKIHRKSLAIRYDKRTFKFYPDSRKISLTTVYGRLTFTVANSPLIDKYRGEYTNAQVIFDMENKKIYAMIQVKIEEVNEKIDRKDVRVLGIDRGVNNIAVLSNNMFFNSRHLRDVKGRYMYLRRKLQHLGTRSAHRKLKELSGRERRFVLATNHVIAKKIVTLPYDVFVLEDLKSSKMRNKGNGRKFNRKLGNWSPYQLKKFIEYKAEELGKIVLYVDPKYTSQRCSRCGYVDKNNRKGSTFKCKQCSFEIHADLNASRNIEVLGKSEYLRLLSTSQSLRLNESMLTGVVETSNKPHPLGWGS